MYGLNLHTIVKLTVHQSHLSINPRDKKVLTFVINKLTHTRLMFIWWELYWWPFNVNVYFGHSFVPLNRLLPYTPSRPCGSMGLYLRIVVLALSCTSSHL